VIAPLSAVGSTLRPDETARRFYLARAWAGLLTTGPMPASVGGDPFLTLTWRPLAEKLHARGAKLFLQIALDGSAPGKAAALAATAPNGLFDGLCLYAREQAEGLLETVRLIRARLPRSFPILCRVSLSPAVYESGLTPEKGQTPPTVGEQLTLFAELSKAGVDAFEVSLGGPATPWLLEPASQLPEGCFTEAARAVKTQFLCLGIRAQAIAFGRLWRPDTAEKLLRRRDCG
jgi:2,4-dienoyl-CoA reductase-like NADH-dependent reductase (Old Yellow Enzyme family)